MEEGVEGVGAALLLGPGPGPGTVAGRRAWRGRRRILGPLALGAGLPAACVRWELGAARIPVGPTVSCATSGRLLGTHLAPFLIKASFTAQAKKKLQSQKNVGICSLPQNRADIVPAFQSSAALILGSTTQLVPTSQRLSVVFLRMFACASSGQ